MLIKLNFDKAKLTSQTATNTSSPASQSTSSKETANLSTTAKPLSLAERLAQAKAKREAELVEKQKQVAESLETTEASVSNESPKPTKPTTSSAKPLFKFHVRPNQSIDQAIAESSASFAQAKSSIEAQKLVDSYQAQRENLSTNKSLGSLLLPHLEKVADKMNATAQATVQASASVSNQSTQPSPLTATQSTTPPTNVVARPTETKSPTFNWDESQLRAIDQILANPFNCLIGAAGSGKTTVVKEIVARLESNGFIQPLAYVRSNGQKVSAYNISFVSFTGKAVEQLRKSIPQHLQCCCMTIHNLLEYAPVDEEKVVTLPDGSSTIKTSRIFRPRRDEINKLPQEIIFIDEAGMVSVDLWNNLCKALDTSNPRLKICLIGDIYQLPAVIGKSILGYGLSSTRWKTSVLTKIHRQALDNPIIANAHRIKSGQQPQPAKPSADGSLRPFSTLNIGCLTPSEREKVKSGLLPRDHYDTKNKPFSALKSFCKVIASLYRSQNYDPVVDQIIVPQNVGLLGQEIINDKLAPLFNPDHKRIPVKASSETKFLAVGDKVMFTKNDYDYGILNGMVGYIEDIQLNGNYKDYFRLKAMEASGSSTSDFVVTDDSADFADAVLDDLNSLEKSNEIDYEKSQAEQQASHVITIKYTPLGETEPASISISTVGAIRGLLLAYAITCHKAQGSEYRRVIVLCHSANSQMLSREWLYTAVTRARENLILVYNDYNGRGLTSALRRQVVKGDTLEEKAKNFSLAEAESESTKLNQALIPLGVF